MKRFGRIVFNGLAAVSWLPCLATGTFFVRGFIARDAHTRLTRYENPDGTTIVSDTISSERGQLGLTRYRMQYGRGPWPPGWSNPDSLWDGLQDGRVILGQTIRGRDSFWFHSVNEVRPVPGTSSNFSTRALVVPLWLLFAATAALPAWQLRDHFRRRRFRRRQRLGLCPSCGYDLRGTPDRCPECGAVPLERI